MYLPPLLLLFLFEKCGVGETLPHGLASKLSVCLGSQGMRAVLAEAFQEGNIDDCMISLRPSIHLATAITWARHIVTQVQQFGRLSTSFANN